MNRTYSAYIPTFCTEIGFPAEAVEALRNAYIALQDGALSHLIADYDADRIIDHPAALDAVKAQSDACGVPWQTAQLLLYVCFSRRLRERYAAAGIDDALFLRAMDDLRCKLWECKRMYGIWGSFVAAWFCRFFDMTRFALGRLQYEPDIYDGPAYTVGAHTLQKGDPVLNVHIPSSGPLVHEEVLASYAQAKVFFAGHFGEKPPVCMCHSWLLNPAIADMLPDSSRIVRFARTFTVTRVDPDPAFGDAWRLYNVEYTGNPAALPHDTTFQRGYADYLANGGVAAEGFGIRYL